MDPVTAFGLATSVLAVVDFGLKTITTFHKLYDEGSGRNEQVEWTQKDFSSAISKLQLSIRDAQTPTVLNQDDQALYDLSQRCTNTADQLATVFSKLTVMSSGRLERSLETAKKTVSSILKAGKLKALENELVEYRRALDTRVLLSLRERFNAIDAKDTEMFKTLDAAIQAVMAAVASNRTTLQQVIEYEQTATRDHIIVILQQIQTRQEHVARVLQSLYFPEMMNRQDAVHDSYSNTFEWVLDPSENTTRPWHNFRQWLETGNDIYWINGKPGSGKSTLMKYLWSDSTITEALKSWAGTMRLLRAAFFAWRPSAVSMLKNANGLMRSLLHQLLESNTALIPAVVSEKNDIPVWTSKNLGQTLTKLIDSAKGSTKFAIFLDGLDELEGDLDILFEILEYFHSASHLKMCVSSRPERRFECVLYNSPKLRLQDLNAGDIDKFSRGKIAAQCKRLLPDQVHPDPSSIAQLVNTIQEKAQGVFIWVSLAVEYVVSGIRDESTDAELLDAINLMPPELDDLYHFTIMRIDQLHRKDAAMYMRVVLEARCKVSLIDVTLSTAKGIVHDNKDESIFSLIKACKTTRTRLITRCLGLIELTEHVAKLPRFQSVQHEHKELVDHHHTYVAFLHRTAYDYFEQNSEVLSNMDLNVRRADIAIALAHSQVFRLKILPWIEVGVVSTYLKEVSHALQFIFVSEIESKSPQPEILELLNTEMIRLHFDTPQPSSYQFEMMFRHDFINQWNVFNILDAYTAAPSPDQFMNTLGRLFCAFNLPYSGSARIEQSNVSERTVLLNYIIHTISKDYNMLFLHRADWKSTRQEMIQLLLQSGAEPGKEVFEIQKYFEQRSAKPSWSNAGYSGHSAWEYYLRTLCRTRLPATLHEENCLSVFRAFLDAGADPNKRLIAAACEEMYDFNGNHETWADPEAETHFSFRLRVLPLFVARTVLPHHFPNSRLLKPLSQLIEKKGGVWRAEIELKCLNCDSILLELVTDSETEGSGTDGMSDHLGGMLWYFGMYPRRELGGALLSKLKAEGCWSGEQGKLLAETRRKHCEPVGKGDCKIQRSGND